MAGLADFGYLYNFTNPQSAFASRLPVDPNAPKVGGLPSTMSSNLTELKTFRDSQEAIVNQAATSAKNNAILGESLPSRDLPPVYVDGRLAPVISVAPAQVNQSNVQSPVLGAAQADINVPPEPTVTIFKRDGTEVVVPVSQRAQVEAQIEAQNRADINEEIRLKDQAVAAAEQAAREKARAGLKGPTNFAPISAADAAAEEKARILRETVPYGLPFGEMGLTSQTSKQEVQKVIYNGEEITKAAYDKLVGMSPILAEAINDKNNKTIKLLVDTATRAGVDPKIAVTTAVMESSLNTATGDSPVGAKGLMQVMPGTFEGTRLKFLKSSDPALRALAESLPSYAVVGSRRPNSDKIDYSWNSKVKLTDEQQAAAGVLYLRSLKDDYPERPDNVIFAMYHAGPGHRAFGEGKIPDTLGDRGVDKNGVAFGMFTSDYSTAAIGLYNQLALAGFGEKPLPKPNTTAGLRVDPAQPANQIVDPNSKAGVVPQSANQNNANQNPVSLGNPALPNTSFMIDIPPAQRAADLRMAQAAKNDVVAQLQAESDLRTRRAQEDDYKILADYEAKAAVILREIELAQIGRNPETVTTKQAELAKLKATTQESRVAKARAFEDSVVATNQSSNATVRLHDLSIQGLTIQETITNFMVNGDPNPLNNLLREVAGSDTILQPLASGEFAVLVRKPNTNEYVYQTDKSGNMTQLNKNAALDFARQIIDPRYAAAVTAAVAESTKNRSEKILDMQIKMNEEAAKLAQQLYNKTVEQVTQADIDAKLASGELVAAKLGEQSVFYMKGNPQYLFMLEPGGEIIAADGSVMQTSPRIVAVPLPSGAGLRVK